MNYNRYLLFMCLILLSSSMVMAGTVTRSFSQNPADPGSIVEVTLTVTTDPGDNKVVLEEIVPSSLFATPLGGEPYLLSSTEAGKLKIDKTSAMSGEYKYSFLVPLDSSDPYIFNGNYILTGTTKNSIPASSLTITSSGSDATSTGNADFTIDAGSTDRAGLFNKLKIALSQPNKMVSIAGVFRCYFDDDCLIESYLVN